MSPPKEYSNDPLREWTGDKGITLSYKDDEIVNEPDDVKEESEQIKPQDESFSIDFEHQDTWYKAQVTCQHGMYAGYLVRRVEPTILRLPDPFPVLRSDENKFEYPVNPTYYPASLGSTIVRAIRNCAGKHKEDL